MCIRTFSKTFTMNGLGCCISLCLGNDLSTIKKIFIVCSVLGVYN